MDWRVKLNQLVMDFWCDIGVISELPAWADCANLELGVVHPDVWALYSNPEKNKAKEILINIAQSVNGFYPESLEAKPFAMNSFRKALSKFINCEINIQELCKLVERLDSVFMVRSRLNKNPFDSQTEENIGHSGFLGNLYNCCDWCDESWTRENSPHLIAEAERLLSFLNKDSELKIIPS